MPRRLKKNRTRLLPAIHDELRYGHHDSLEDGAIAIFMMECRVDDFAPEDLQALWGKHRAEILRTWNHDIPPFAAVKYDQGGEVTEQEMARYQELFKSKRGQNGKRH